MINKYNNDTLKILRLQYLEDMKYKRACKNIIINKWRAVSIVLSVYRIYESFSLFSFPVFDRYDDDRHSATKVGF